MTTSTNSTVGGNAGGAHTPGPLVARRINDDARPFAVINQNGPHGDEIVAGYLSEADANLYAAAPDMAAELSQLELEFESFIECGTRPTDEWLRDNLASISALVAKATGAST